MAGADRLRDYLGSGFAGSLRVRVLFLILASFVAVAIPAFVAFQYIVGATTVGLSTLFAERQILYDRHRGLGPLEREVALAETLARSPTILAWAASEDAPHLRAGGVAELEHFRLAFQDRSYFFALAESGNYYYNDREGSFAGAQLRYTLSPANASDAWFYRTLALGPGCRLNVNNDRALKVTKVWINCVVEGSGGPLGVLGTGIDLSAFVDEVVNSQQRGVESMFVDAGGAIQAIRDQSRIDFHSLTKQQQDRNTVFRMLDDEADRALLADMMAKVRGKRADVAARFMTVGGKETLVGVAHLGPLDWYNVTLMDVDAIVDRGVFAPIGALIGLMMMAAALLVTWLFKKSVLDRLARAETSLGRIERGDFGATVEEGRSDEIGRLAAALNRMAAAVRDNTDHLEAAVRERTHQLERIAFLDAMTGVPNRRGFAAVFEQEQAHETALGLLLMDVDLFKAINDTRGHQAGDEVIAEVARRISAAIGETETCARWGGDEFVVMVRDATDARLERTGRRIADALRGRAVRLSDGSSLRITTSIGASLLGTGDTLSAAAAKADIALYEAKRAGRNRLVLYDPAQHAPHDGRMKVA